MFYSHVNYDIHNGIPLVFMVNYLCGYYASAPNLGKVFFALFNSYGN